MNADGLLERLFAYVPVMAQGASMTLWVSCFAIAMGMVLGAALLGLSLANGGRGPLKWFVTLYVSFFRGTPLLVQFLTAFYLPSSFGWDFPPLLVAIVVMALNSAAFQSVILRAGLAAIPAGQLEAAYSFGMGQRQVFWKIQLPQLARTVWPAVVSEAMDVVKNSAIVSVIAVADLARVTRQIFAANYRPLEVFMSSGLVYLLLTGAVFALGTWVGRRMHGVPRSVAGNALPLKGAGHV
ncbi:MAG: amino acid ABC transporter permease [Gammaproteobacteria bacterium]|nr:amino acid ABC transporter permease [Gammaproteobacteria bacterium]